jgi:hypothetical protein
MRVRIFTVQETCQLKNAGRVVIGGTGRMVAMYVMKTRHVKLRSLSFRSLGIKSAGDVGVNQVLPVNPSLPYTIIQDLARAGEAPIKTAPLWVQFLTHFSRLFQEIYQWQYALVFLYGVVEKVIYPYYVRVGHEIFPSPGRG